MKKIILASLALIIPLFSYAVETVTPYPTNFKGIQIVPVASMNYSNDIQAEMLNNASETSRKGYQETDDSDRYATFLLSLKKNAPAELRSFAYLDDPTDTHLKSKVDQIKLAFHFKNVNFIKEENIIGYAAGGSYIENKGWTGIVMFFDSPLLGTCSYSIYPIISVQLSQESTEYLVNNKPSTKVIQGNKNAGYVYTLDWYTNSNMSILECANTSFDKSIMNEMISVANKFDKR